MATICFLCSIDMAGAVAQPQILILNSYHQGEDWSDNELSGIRACLNKPYPFLVPAIEHLDAKRFPGRDHLLFLKDYLKAKYQGKRLDLVFVLDNPALDLLTGYGQDIFPGIPIVGSVT